MNAHPNWDNDDEYLMDDLYSMNKPQTGENMTQTQITKAGERAQEVNPHSVDPDDSKWSEE